MDEQTDLGANVTPLDMIRIQSVLPISTTRVLVQIEGSNLRINFGNIVGGEPVYHAAIVVSAKEALGYASLINTFAERAIEQTSAEIADGL